MQTAINYDWIALPTGLMTMPEFRKERLRDRRKDMGFSQVTLAEAVKVGQSEVSQWETGKRTPEPENIAKLCKALEVTMDYLFGLVDRPHDVLRESGLSEFEFKVVHRMRIDEEFEQRVDDAFLINAPKKRPALPEPNKEDKESRAASSGE